MDKVKRDIKKEELRQKEKDMAARVRADREEMKVQIEAENLKEKMIQENNEKRRLEELLGEKRRLNNKILNKGNAVLRDKAHYASKG